MSQHELLWTPSDVRVQRSQMYQLMTRLAGQYGFSAQWPAFHSWSVEHRDRFWKEMFDYAQIKVSQPAGCVVSGQGMLGTRWFKGLRFNFAQHLLRFSDDRIAIESEDERGRTRSITYRELRHHVALLASAMRQAGVRPGDRIGGFLPNIPEAVFAMLATASIGAAWSSCSPDFGIGGVFDRFGQIEPKMLFAIDGYSYNGKKIDSRDRVRGIVEKIPSIERVVIVPFMDESPNLSGIANGSLWSEFVALGTSSIAQAEARGSDAKIDFEQVLFDHPLYIMYSSGTTGIPKCIVHGHGGTLIQHMKELMLHCDLRRDDAIFYFTTCGWMMWNWLVSSLGVGATVVLYEGAPFHPDPDYLWRMAERLGITVFGTSPKYVAACENAGLTPGKQHDLSRLRAVLSTGSPLTPENFRWVYKNIKSDLQLSSISGGTDIISCFMLGNPMLPVRAGEIQCLGLGMDVKALDSNGKPVIGQKGELVCCSPFPSQPTGFWNDPDGEKYRKAYFDVYPGIWQHGDFVEITPHGGVIVYGRSDATLNPGGVRIGTAEIYRQVETLDEITDSIVVGKDTPDADVEVCLFVVLREGLTLDQALIDKIKQRIVEGATKRHVPKHIKQVTAIPYTISGKKVELAVRQMIHGENVPNRDALANPEALNQYAGIV
jgi:acetoacetyl-CoA synthetase